MTDKPRKALVTGASSGLGAEFSRQLASQCDEMILTGRQRQPLAALAGELEKDDIDDVERSKIIEKAAGVIDSFLLRTDGASPNP